MVDVVGAYEAKTRLPALLERVERGEQIVITRHGRPIARIVPIDSREQDRRAAAIEKLKTFSKGRTLGIPLKELIEEGRK